jgi:hypothetical protein
MRTAPSVDISREILSYLTEHPMAQDTLEGIVEWWLLEQEIQRRTTKVQAALADLIDQGLVLERTGRDERKHYRLNRRKLNTVHALLRQYGVNPADLVSRLRKDSRRKV